MGRDRTYVYVNCKACGEPYPSASSASRYCSAKCRKRISRLMQEYESRTHAEKEAKRIARQELDS